MSKVFFAGDCHGNVSYLKDCVEKAAEAGAEVVLQVGDFAENYTAHITKGVEKLLVAKKLTLMFACGNHEDFGTLRSLPTMAGRTGIKMLSPHILYGSRGGVHTLSDGTRVVFAGGAISVDRELRKSGARRGKWWPEEVISEGDVQQCLAAGTADIVVSHDSPSEATLPDVVYRNVLERGLRQDCEDNRVQLQRIVDGLQPKLLVHGHYHHYYEDTLDDTSTRVVGLSKEFRPGATLVVDTADLNLAE